jgi:protocatechuate 3,4-dioxygenase beta subunit
MNQQPRDWEVHPPYLYPDYKSTIFRAPSKPLIPMKHTLSESTGQFMDKIVLENMIMILPKMAFETVSRSANVS